MPSAEFCLVEHCGNDFEPPCDRIVSLSPSSSHFLASKKIPYTCIENYYSETAFRRDEDAYFRNQALWFEDFDVFFRQSFESSFFGSFSLARAFYSRLKYLVDSTIIRARIVSDFMKKTSAQRISFYFKREIPADRNTTSIYDFQSHSRYSLLPFFLTYAGQHKRLELLLFPQEPNRELQVASNSKCAKKKSFLRRIAKCFYLAVKYQKIRWPFQNEALDGLNFLLLDRGSSEIDPVVRKLIMAGANVYFNDGKSITSVNSLWENEILDLESTASASRMKYYKRLCVIAYEQLSRNHPVIQWINKQCDFDVSEYILPYLKDFIINICPQTCAADETIQGFIRAKKINFVIARACSGQAHVGSLLAADSLGVKSICFQHGSGAIEMLHYLNELRIFNHYFAIDSFSAKYFAEMSRKYGNTRAQIFCSPHYFENCKRSFFVSRRHFLASKRPRVTFVVHHNLTNVREFHHLGYSPIWYYEFHKKIIDFFCARGEYEFVYKLPSGASEFAAAITSFIESKRCANVAISCRPFKEHLRRTERVLVDYPATAFFEAISSGISTFAICADFLELQEDQAKAWQERGMLAKFSDFEEAISQISNFLASPASCFCYKFDSRRTDLVKTIKQIHNSKE